MKIHPLFKKAIWNPHSSYVGQPHPIDEWNDAGCPVVEEEPFTAMGLQAASARVREIVRVVAENIVEKQTRSMIREEVAKVASVSSLYDTNITLSANLAAANARIKELETWRRPNADDLIEGGLHHSDKCVHCRALVDSLTAANARIKELEAMRVCPKPDCVHITQELFENLGVTEHVYNSALEKAADWIERWGPSSGTVYDLARDIRAMKKGGA
jgi:hypothetical protein